MTARRSGLAAAALAAVLLAAAPAPAAMTVKRGVQQYMRWVNRTRNFLAEIDIRGQQVLTSGRVCTDLTVVPHQSALTGTLTMGKRHYAFGLGCKAGTMYARVGPTRGASWTLGQGPFYPGGAPFSIFRRGDSIRTTMKRLNDAVASAQVLENPHGGTTGLRLVFAPTFLDKVYAAADRLVLGQPLPRAVDVTIWMDSTGRPERVVVNEGTPSAQVSSFHYLRENMPQASVQVEIDSVNMRSVTAWYPSFGEMLRSVEQEALNGAP